MKARIGKWGKSLAVRIPGAYAKDLNLKEGMDLEMSVVASQLVLCPLRETYTLEDLVTRITPENLRDETDWGPAVGRESW